MEHVTAMEQKEFVRFSFLRNKGHFCHTKLKVLYVVKSRRWENSRCHISNVFNDSLASNFFFRTDLKPPSLL